MTYPYNHSTRGVKRSEADTGLIDRGSIAFTSGNDLTTEIKTSAVSLPSTQKDIHPDALFLLAIEKPAENTALDLTVKTYNVTTINATARDTLHTSHTVEVITSADTYRDFLIQGLFIGDGQIKIGALFAVDSGAITVYYSLYRV